MQTDVFIIAAFVVLKRRKNFRRVSGTEILEQIRQLKILYGRNLENYNALFLGNHDALAAGEELIYLAASEASHIFGFEGTRTNTPILFLFGSVDSLLKSKMALFEKISSLPFYTYINIGFESIDPPTLKFIGKPVSASMVREAFMKMLDLNANYPNIEITGNFLMGNTLSPEHYQSLAELLGDASVPSKGKGAIYLSPIKDSPKKRELLPQFYEIKNQSQLPVFFYLIQRL